MNYKTSTLGVVMTAAIFFPNKYEAQPANDLCENAEEIVVQTPGTCAPDSFIGSTTGSSDETGAFYCDDNGGPWTDVFYTFNSGTYSQISLQRTWIYGTDLVTSVSVSCSDEPFYCYTGFTTDVINVDTNTDYIIRCGSNLTYGGQGNFGLCLSGVTYCPDLEANIGDPCDDLNENTENDMVNGNCECYGEPIVSSILNGIVDINQDCTERSVEISIYAENVIVDNQNVTLDQAGEFSIETEAIGAHDIYVKIEGYLRKAYYSFEINNGINLLNIDVLTPGELNGDDGVNIADVSVLNAAFGSVIGDGNYNQLTDMNCDGGVNIVDVSVLNSSFGMVGQILP